jgi:hypothetical protein
MHADPEALLLIALAAPIAPDLQGWLEAHLGECDPCAARLESLLALRGHEQAVEPLTAAAATSKTFEAPAPLEALGKLGGVTVYRLAGEPPRLAVDSVEWIGKKLRLTIPGEAPILARVDDFRRLRVEDGLRRLVAALEARASVGVELVD